MTAFDTFVMVDWSGGGDTGPRPRKDAIWAAVAREGVETRYLRNRTLAMGWLGELLREEIAAGRRVLAGFDFPMGYPSGFAAAVAGSADPLRLWDRLAEELADGDRFAAAARLNALFPGTGPFWFNGGKADHPGLPRRGSDRQGHGLPERRHVESLAKGTFTCWQLGGAGSVGSQVLTGLAALSGLRRELGEAVAVWPFEAREAPVVIAEIWPSLLAEAMKGAMGEGAIRDEVQVRTVALTLAEMQRAGTLEGALAAVGGPDLAEEGWILGVGAEGPMRAAARAALNPGLHPPRLQNDCFALPPGVDWMPVDQALGLLHQRLTPVTATETVKVPEALDRILAEAPVARRGNPPAPNSAVDGYGFAHAATAPGRMVLPLLPGRSAAGAPYDGAVPQGHALRILTGALLPPGVDTVVLQEDVTVAEGHVAFEGPVKQRANTRRGGEDVAEGAPVLMPGHRLRPPDLALLSAVGITEIAVRRRLRVGVLSTGDEIAAPGATADPARTYDANRPMLLSLATAWGCEAVDLGHQRDDRRALAATLDRGAAEADVILTSGGASGGDEDHVSKLLTGAGAIAWRIAVKPGRPLALGLWQGTPVFGLPGNPVAALVCTLIFARPALSVLAGGPWLEPQVFTVPAAFTKAKRPGRREYLRARLTAEGAVEVFRSEGSGRISGLSWATGLVEIEDGPRQIAPGDPVRFLPYSGFGF